MKDITACEALAEDAIRLLLDQTFKSYRVEAPSWRFLRVRFDLPFLRRSTMEIAISGRILTSRIPEREDLPYGEREFQGSATVMKNECGGWEPIWGKVHVPGIGGVEARLRFENVNPNAGCFSRVVVGH